jgi:hypothetical protein
MDNAKPHNSCLSIQKMVECGFIRVPKSCYSPDLQTCDFFLFGRLMSQLERNAFLDKDNLKKEVARLLTEMPITLFGSFIDEWVPRLMRSVERGGNYVL